MNFGQYNTQQYNTARPSQYRDVSAASRVSAGRRILARVAQHSAAQCSIMLHRITRARRAARAAVMADVPRLILKRIKQASRLSAFDTRATHATRSASNARAWSAWQAPRALAVGRLAVSMATLGLVERYKAMILSTAVSAAKAARTSLIAVNTLSSAVAGGVAAWAQRITEARRTAKASTVGGRRIVVVAMRRAISAPAGFVARIVDRWIATVRPTMIELEALITRIFKTENITVVVKLEKPPARIVNEREQ